jgi:hypothetical protein
LTHAARLFFGLCLHAFSALASFWTLVLGVVGSVFTGKTGAVNERSGRLAGTSRTGCGGPGGGGAVVNVWSDSLLEPSLLEAVSWKW